MNGNPHDFPRNRHEAETTLPPGRLSDRLLSVGPIDPDNETHTPTLEAINAIVVATPDGKEGVH